MDKYTATVIGVSLPALAFAMLYGASSSLYDVAPPVARAEAAVTEEAETAPAEDQTEDIAAVDAETEETDAAALSADPVDPTVADDADAVTGDADTSETEPMETADADEGAKVDEVESDAATDDPVELAIVDTDEIATESDTAAAEAPTLHDEPASASIDLAAIREAGDAQAGSRLWRQCSACHVADQAQNRVGPHLVDIIGRPQSAVDGFRYSGALPTDGAWTVEELDAWLENPRDYAQGTSMSYRGLSDAVDRADILAYLADLQLDD
ncbi:MAG: c-type cytochrome [Pseudomonadota bacterium]